MFGRRQGRDLHIPFKWSRPCKRGAGQVQPAGEDVARTTYRPYASRFLRARYACPRGQSIDTAFVLFRSLLQHDHHHRQLDHLHHLADRKPANLVSIATRCEAALRNEKRARFVSFLVLNSRCRPCLTASAAFGKSATRPRPRAEAPAAPAATRRTTAPTRTAPV